MKKIIGFFLAKKELIIVVAILTLVSCVALTYYFLTGLNFAYNDATSHLNISRRVIDSLTPGIVQIGSTWLPMLHLLTLLFSWNDFLWQSGLSGAFVSGTCYVLAGYYFYRSIRLFTNDKWAAVIGLSVYISNANMLYMQTTAMFEPLLVCTLAGAVYFLLKWYIKQETSSMILSSVFLFAAVLTRYDGWILMASAMLSMVAVLIFKTSFKKIESHLIVYAAPPVFGLGMWLMYNLLIFGNPLYFAFNEYSAHAQQTDLFAKGMLPTKGNPLLAFVTYSEAVLLNLGVIYTALAVVGILIFIYKSVFGGRKYIIPIVFLAPYAFNILALFLGHSVIWIPNLPPYANTFFNVRYGILSIGAIVFFIGYLASIHKVFKGALIVAIVVQTMLFYSLLPGRNERLTFVTLRDTVASINVPTQIATNWLRDNYEGGLILISSASSESFIFNSGIMMRNFITEGTGKYYKTSLINPSKYANYVVYFPSHTDRVGKKIYNNNKFHRDFKLVFENETYLIYKKKEGVLTDSDSIAKARKEEIIPYSYMRKTEYTRFNNVLPEDYRIINQIFTK